MPTGEKIDLNYARQLVQNYADTKLGTVLPANETRAVWFAKDVMLQALGLPPDTDTGNVTGIRIYLGAYKEQQGYPQNPVDYNTMTLVVVPTGKVEMMIDRGGISEIAYMDNIEDDEASKTQPSYPTGPAADRNAIINDGQRTPPPDLAVGLGLMDW